MESCQAVLAPGTQWNFCPNLGASIFFLVLFTLTTTAHVIQAIHYRKSYCWVIIMSGLWQVLTYIFRTISIETPSSFGMYAAWFVLILIAPLWTNGFAYMVLGRMVWTYAPGRRLWGLKAGHYGLIFVTLDIIAFVIQVVGAAQAAGDNEPYDTVMEGLHIYMGGVSIQLLFILVFSAFAVKFFFTLRANSAGKSDTRPALVLLYTQVIVLALVVLRIIFRLIEYSSGINSTIPNHEAFQYCLDSLPMFAALVAYNVVHPGRIMQGPEGDMPSMWRRLSNRFRRRGSAISLMSQRPRADDVA